MENLSSMYLLLMTQGSCGEGRDVGRFFHGSATTGRDVAAEFNMDKLPENQQVVFLKGVTDLCAKC